MKRSRHIRTRLAACCALAAALVSVPAFAAQSTLLADTYVTSLRPSTNYGTLTNLYVNANSTALLRFDLAALPPDAIAATIGRAVLRIYVNRVNAPGTLAVAAVGSDWREGAVTFQTLPQSGSVADSESASAEGQFVAFDVTALVKQWAAAPTTNFGFSITTAAADVVLDSKESDTTAHPATLDVTMLAAAGTPGPQGVAGPQGPVGASGATGATGAIGPQGPKGDTGGLAYRGAFSRASTYSSSDVVAYNGGAWVSLQNSNTGNVPGTTSTQWGVLVPAPPATTTSSGTNPTTGLVYRGSFNSGNTYAANEVVSYNSAAWVSLLGNNTGNPPVDGGSYWAVLVPAAVSTTTTTTTTANTPSLGYKGNYASATIYGLNDVVAWANGAWVSIASTNRGNQPDTAPAYWAVLVPAALSAASSGSGNSNTTPSLSYKGAYASSTNYGLNDVVTWQAAAWISLSATNVGNTPDQAPAAWAVLVPAAVGIQGATGTKGDTGASGAQGVPGVTGPAGPAGPQGATGAMGRPGFTYRGGYQPVTNYAAGDVVLWQGSSWASLADSNTGNTPDQSPQQWGLLTSMGPQGATGLTGATGAPGPQGLPGSTGAVGQQGPAGPAGATGPQGAPGRDGAQGPQGNTGPAGPQGVAGPVGITWQGTYAPATNYAVNDAVTWQGQSWLSATAGNHGNTPGTTADWTLLAAAGVTGPEGLQGLTGPQGATGYTGATGAQGPQGSQGPAGPQGDPGMVFQGGYDPARNYALHDSAIYGGGTWLSLSANNHGNTPGTTADWVELAAPGAPGATGPQGATGNIGPAGPKGDPGATGALGPTGPQGVQGPPVVFRGAWNNVSAYATGDAVFYNGSSWIATAQTGGTPPGSAPQWSLLAQQGLTGATGATGTAGSQGVPGATGATGSIGPQGAPGLNWLGAYSSTANYGLRDAVSYNGSSFVSLAANNVGNIPGTAGVTQWTALAIAGVNGGAGVNGTSGAPGAAASVAVRNVTSGTTASVTNAGTAQAAILDFVLPKGDTGATGATGPAGVIFRGAWSSGGGYNKGDGVSLNGSSYVSLTPNNLSNPETDLATSGGNWALLASQGATGANGAATVTVGTVSSGSTASVTNVGTTTAAKLNFVLPQGPAGAAGAAGPAGLTWRGAWLSGTAYAINDAVSYAGSAYIAIAANQGTAPTGATYSANAWALLAAAGATGPTGTTPSLSVGTVTTGAPGSNAAVTLTTNGTATTLNFTIPQGQTGAAGSSGSGGSGTTSTGAGGGAVFTGTHQLPSSGNGLQFYAVNSSGTRASEGSDLLTLMPATCTVSSIAIYNTGSQGALLYLRSGTNPLNLATMTNAATCSNIAAGASTCNFNSINLGAKFVDLEAGSANGSSYLYTVFTCN